MCQLTRTCQFSHIESSDIIAWNMAHIELVQGINILENSVNMCVNVFASSKLKNMKLMVSTAFM